MYLTEMIHHKLSEDLVILNDVMHGQKYKGPSQKTVLSDCQGGGHLGRTRDYECFVCKYTPDEGEDNSTTAKP